MVDWGADTSESQIEREEVQMIPWIRAFLNRLPGQILSLMLFRALVLTAVLAWLAFATLPSDVRGPVSWLLLGFLGYCLFLFLALSRWTRRVIQWNLLVLGADLAFALGLVRLTGGIASEFNLAFYLIAALQSYYYGLRRGIAVTAVSIVFYLGVVWPTLDPAHWPEYALRGAFLFLTATVLGLFAERETRERGKITALNQDLQVKERFIRNVVESLADGVIVLDRDRRIIGWNRAMEVRYRVPGDEVFGKRFFDIFPNFRREGLEEVVSRLYEGKEENFVLERFEHLSRHLGWVILNLKGSVIRDRGGEVDAVVLLQEDITERLELERSIQQSEKLAAVGTLSAGLAHEVNNPIGIIVSRIELMLGEAEEQRLPPAVRKDLEVLARHAHRVARIAQGLLSFARQAPGTKALVDLNVVVEETLLLTEKQVAREGIALKGQLVPELPAVYGDANQLQQVVLNLVTNAREAITEGGEIRVETCLAPNRPGWACLRVSDTGPGIPPDIQPRIFDPFFTTKDGGTGLGLSVSYGIIKGHNGFLEVATEPGQGTTFTVLLPPAGQRSA